MKELLRRLLIRPGLSIELILASLFANLLALAPPLFVIQVLNRYVAHGVDSTLMTLTIGVVIAVALEFAFRQVRNRLAKGVSAKPDQQIAQAGFGVLATAKAGALDRLPPGQQREIMSGIDNIRNAYGAANISTILDLPFALLFLGVLYLLTPVLGIIATIFAAISLLIGLLLMATIRQPTRQLTDTARRALRFVPPTVLLSLIMPAILRHQGQLDLTLDNPRFYAGLIAGLVAYKTKSVLFTLVVGMGLLYLLQNLL